MIVEIQDGFKIHYDEYGKDNSKHILFIHSLGSSSATWKDIPQAFGEHYHTICVDLIGFGFSDKPELDYTISYFAQFIKSFLLHVGFTPKEKLIIIGHGLGGYITIEYVIENREQIERFVLIDSYGMLSEPTPLLEHFLDAGTEANPNIRDTKIQKVMRGLLAYPGNMPYFLDSFVITAGSPGARHAFESAFRHNVTTTMDLERLKLIQNIPCLILWGEKDNLIPLENITKFTGILNNAQQIIIPNAGHSPFFEKPVIVYEKIRTFIESPIKS